MEKKKDKQTKPDEPTKQDKQTKQEEKTMQDKQTKHCKQTKLAFVNWHAMTQSPSCRHFWKMWVKMEQVWSKQNKTAILLKQLCKSPSVRTSLSQKEWGYGRGGAETNPRDKIKTNPRIQLIPFPTVPLTLTSTCERDRER